jgi:Caspase domain
MDPARDALIVAVSDYRDPKLRQLRAPVADASALGRVLEDPSIGGFRVQLALDEDESALTRRLARFFSDRRPDDLLLIHFSCHGIKDASGELYMAAADTETDLLSATGIPSRWLSEQIGKCRSKRIVVLLDCCFSGSFAFGTSFRAGDEVNVQQHLEGRGRVVITASNAMEYAFEGDQLSGSGQPSIFTAAVVEGLETGKADRDGDQLVSVDELYDYVFDRVREATPNQSPTKLSSLEGPLYVARSQFQRPVEPVVLPQELMDLTHHPYAEARLGAVAELSRLLASNNPGVRLSARLTLESMVGDDSRKVSDRVREVLSQRSITGPVAVEEVREQLAPEAAAEIAPELKTEERPAAPAPAARKDGVLAPLVPSPPAPTPRDPPAREFTRDVRAIGPADRRRIAAVAAGGIALSALGALLGAALSWPVFKSAGYLGNGTAVAAVAILTTPMAIALMAIAVWSRAAAFSASLGVGGFVVATGIASLGGLIHYSNNPRTYFIVVNVIGGLGLGVASTVLRRELRTLLIAIGLGALAGVLAGALTPIPAFTHRGAWTAAQVLSAAIGVAPLCVLIGWLPRASGLQLAPNELDPSVARESPLIG